MAHSARLRRHTRLGSGDNHPSSSSDKEIREHKNQQVTEHTLPLGSARENSTLMAEEEPYKTTQLKEPGN
eukprot:1705430-Amphidinium_carterae.1